MGAENESSSAGSANETSATTETKAATPQPQPGQAGKTSVRPGAAPSSHRRYSSVQLSGSAAGADPSAITETATAGVSSGGGSLPFRAEMESAFGTSFGDVRAHTGSAAAGASRSIGAEAYTVGTDIAFATPPSPALVAHELTHVVQQKAGAVPDGVGSAGDRFEREADLVASQVSSQGRTDVAANYGVAGKSSPGVQRKAVQRFGSGEHALLGAGRGYPASGATMTLANGATIFTGELVAFGDFYSGLEQMDQAPRQEVEALVGICRLEGVWVQAEQAKIRLARADPAHANTPGATVPDQVAAGAPGGSAVPNAPSTEGSAPGAAPATGTPPGAPGGPSATRLPHRPGTLTSSDPIWRDERAKVDSQLLEALRTNIHTQFAPAWAFFGISLSATAPPATDMATVRATVGRRRFRSGANTPGERGENDSLARPGDPNRRDDPDNPSINSSLDPARLGGDYLDLAQNNVSHFATDNWDTWKALHEQAAKEHGEAADENGRQRAIARDMMGTHYLTDRFCSGHLINKGELMQYATSMMLTQAQAHGHEGDNADAQLNSLMRAAVAACFEDDNVYQQWVVGVNQARTEGVVNDREVTLLNTLPRGEVAKRLVGVIMGMPWRSYDGAATPDTSAEGRSYGPNSVARSSGDPTNGSDYHLGVGNLAALQVHDALNMIGFTAQNGSGNQWRLQGDGQLSAETQQLASQAVAMSTQQVQAGSSQPESIKQLMPSVGWIDPTWIDDYFGGMLGTAEFDQAKLATLRGFVNGRKIPLGVEADSSPVSAEMTSLCHQIMEVLFLAPTGAGASQGDNNTGLNISRLKAFLIARLGGMISMAYLATAAGDLPAAALELYAPRDGDRVLPRSANDFVWSGDNLSFNLNVTGCEGGSYSLVAHVYNQDAGYDIDARGQPFGRGNADASGGFLRGLAGAADAATNGSVRNEDEYITDVNFQVNVAPAPTSSGDPPRRTMPATITVPRQGGLFTREGDRYVTVAGDADGSCVIGRSNVQSDGALPGNPTPATGEPPRVTGSDARAPEAAVRPTGFKDGAVGWIGTSVFFALQLEKQTPADTNTIIYIKSMDWDIIGSDAQIGTPQAVSVVCNAGVNYSRPVVFTPPEDDPNDTYVIVYRDAACNEEIGRSRTQGWNRGQLSAGANQLGRNPAKSVSGMQWNGARLTFHVEPADSDPVFVRFFNKDWGYDYDESGNLESGPRNTDSSIGGIQQVTVQNGIGSAASDGDSDTYGIVYQDPLCAKPLRRSGVHG